jgi:hypothetical protein
MLDLSTIRTAAISIAAFLFLAICSSFISANVRRLAQEKGWDTFFLAAWNAAPVGARNMLSGLAPPHKLWWVWLSLGLSGGLSVALWLLAAQVPATTPATLHDDAAKWKIAKNLHALATTEHGPVKGTCEVVVVRYQLPHAEKDFLDLKEIFDLIDWKYHEAFASSTLPNGLTLKSVQGDVSSSCESLFREQLSVNTSRVTASNSFVENPKEDEHMKACSGPCFEIDIGSEPE